MKRFGFAGMLLAATVLSGAASAKTLVYCSEGSPEGFDPALYTAGTTFDASSNCFRANGENRIGLMLRALAAVAVVSGNAKNVWARWSGHQRGGVPGYPS